jgi:hypothetical protein
LKFLKTTAVEDATITEEILVVDLAAEDAKVALIAKEVVLQEEIVAIEKADSAAIELVQHQEEKVVLEAKEVALLQEEKAVFLIEHQDVLKVQVMPQDQEDQEKVNDNSLIFI